MAAITTQVRTSAQYEGGQLMPIPVNDNDTQHQQTYAANFPQTDRRNWPPYPNQRPWTPQQDIAQQTPEHLPPPSEVNRSDKPPRHLPKDMSRPPTQGAHPPLKDPPSHRRPGPPISRRHVPPSPPQYHYAPLPSQPDYRSPCLPPPPHHTTTTHMRMTSSGYNPYKPGPKTFNKEGVERSRMLRGSTYNHFDTTLVNERQRCERALQRYNDASELGSGVSEMEVRNTILRVFDPTEDTTHKFLAAPQEKGTLGDGVQIEAPFTCTYGYNIKTMDSVYIGKNSTIDDAGKVVVPKPTRGPVNCLSPARLM